MNLPLVRRKPRAADARFSFVPLPVLRYESGSTGQYVVPRLREKATGQVLHLDNASRRFKDALIVGAAGMGKTAALHFLGKAAQSRVVSLADYHPDALPVNFEQNGWILLDDAVGERALAHLEALAARFGKAHIWGATRRIDSAPPGFALLELLPLNEREIVSMAASWFPLPQQGNATPRTNQALEDFVASVKANPGTRELAANPLYLFLLLQVYESSGEEDALPQASDKPVLPVVGGAANPFDVPQKTRISPLPTRRSQLFDRYIKRCLDRESDPDLAARALEGIALSTKRGQIAKAEHLARGYGFLEERPGGGVAFKHSLIQDFLAARALRRNPDIAPLAEHLFDPDWREVVLFYSGLGASAEVATLLVERGEMTFAAYALAQEQDAPSELVEHVIKVLAERAWQANDEEAAEALGAMQSTLATDYFAAKLRDKDPVLRGRAARMLGKLHTDRALEYLLPQLRDTNPEVRDIVVAALGESRSDRVVEPLLVALRGDSRVGTVDTRLRVAAARALGEYGTEKAVPALIVDLQIGEPSVREEAALALEKTRSEFAIKPLTSLVETHPDADVRATAARVLSNLRGE